MFLIYLRRNAYMNTYINIYIYIYIYTYIQTYVYKGVVLFNFLGGCMLLLPSDLESPGGSWEKALCGALSVWPGAPANGIQSIQRVFLSLALPRSLSCVSSYAACSRTF